MPDNIEETQPKYGSSKAPDPKMNKEVEFFTRQSNNPLQRINNRLVSSVISRLPVELGRRLGLGVMSARAKEIIPPSQQRKTLGKIFSPQTIQDISPLAESLAQSVEDESRLGNKILDLDLFQKALDRNYRRIQLNNLDQQAALDYWVKNIHQIPQDHSLFQRVCSVITAESVRSQLSEVGILFTLLKIRGGVALKSKPGILGKAGTFLVDSSVSSSVKTQVRKDILGLGNVEADKRETLRDEFLQGYGYTKDSLEGRVFFHPDYLPRITKAGLSTLTWYSGIRQIVGWSAFGAMSRVTLPFMDVNYSLPFETVESFHSLVDRVGVAPMVLASASVLTGLMIARMGVDCYVLKKRDASPDVVETSLALSAGKIDNYQNLRANYKFGIVGPLVDVAISSLQPPWVFAWGADPPYSIPAYLLAMGADQISFMVSNLGYLALTKGKSGRNNKQ